jgi:hypothetical protein
MQQCISRETDSGSSLREIPRLLWNLKIHYHVHNSPPLAPIMSQMNPVHTPKPYLFKIHFDILFAPRFSK